MTEGDGINNGGVNPSRTDEYREGDRYSVRVVPGETADNSKKDGGGHEDGISMDPTQTGARLSREEIENKYRHDPRFNMLFDLESKKEEEKRRKQHAHSIKVGGIRLTPKRILILCGFFLVFLLCLFSSFFYAIKDIGKYRNYSRAVALFESGDYEAAKEMFSKVLNEDPNKEHALSAMVQIYHHFGDWNNEAFFRLRLIRLNPLNDAYFRDFLDASFRARNFGSIYSQLNLKVMENPEVRPEEGALYVVAAMHTGHASNGRAFFNERKKADPDYFSGTELGRYAEILLDADKMDYDRVRTIAASLDDIKDPQVRFETISTLLAFFTKQRGREANEQTEKLLVQSVELNEFAGAPLLANYYFNLYRFEDTIRVCEEYFKTKMNALMPILYGESCLLSGQSELIPPFAKKMRSLRGRQSIVIASYLDALYAFGEGDEPRLRESMLKTASTIRTNLSTLMRFQLAILAGSPKEILVLLEEIMNGRPFMDFQQRARDAALEYLQKTVDLKLASDPDRLNACAEIAALIRHPDDESPFLTRIIMFDWFKRNVLKPDDLQSAMEEYPGDPVLLQIASEYYLLREQPARAMECISEYNELDIKDKKSLAILHVLALDQLGRKEDAEKEFRDLVEQKGDGLLLYLYFEFCVENQFVESLKSLLSWLESLPNDSANRAAMPFVRAEILLADGKKDQALGLFETAQSNDPQFVFHAATRLAEAGRTDAALARFLSIRDTYSDSVLVNVNLSWLYSEKGDLDKALACARTAWEENQSDLSARYVYAKCLFEKGQFAEAVSVLKFPQYKASFPNDMLELWSKAIREQIKADFATERYTPALENAKHLLLYFPEDSFAQDYIEKVQKIRRHETIAGDGK